MWIRKRKQEQQDNVTILSEMLRACEEKKLSSVEQDSSSEPGVYD